MKIYINQKEIEVQDNISVKELLDMQQIAIEGTAIGHRQQAGSQK